MEPMDVDSIGNDFDDKENSLQNSNVLPRTPSTEKGYEELDVSELNMKLRYSMTPASSPMSRSFTSNCRDNKVYDNENNSINTTLNDNANLTRSFNSTITDSILKSPKLPLQVRPTEQFVDGNGNPIARSLDIECNNVTITVSETDNIDDNLSLPSTSSSLVHTPEATTPTKEISKDGGSPILRGLKSVLNMFRSPQSPIPPDIVTRDFNSFESQKKEEQPTFTVNLASSPTSTTKKNEMTSKTNSPLKESLVFNEDLEKELLWKDETTIIFKEEKVPVHKLFFPLNYAAPKNTNSKPIEKENMNTTVEDMDISFNQTAIADKTMTDIEKFSSHESETLNNPESDSEFVDCESSYTKNDTRVLDDNIPGLSTTMNNISPEFSVTDENTFQTLNIVAEESSLPVLACETPVIMSKIDDIIKEGDIENCKQSIHNDLVIMRKSLDQINILSNSLKEDIFNVPAEQGKSNHDNVNEILQCSNETFNLEMYSDSKDTPIDQEPNNDIGSASDVMDNDASLCKDNENINQKNTKEINNSKSEELTCNLDYTIVLNEHTLKNETDTSKINNIILPLESQVPSEVEIDLVVVQDEIITKNNTDKTLGICEEVINFDNKCNVTLDSEVIKDTIIKQKDNNEKNAFIFPGHIVQLEEEEIWRPKNNNLPSDIPLPYDSDIDKDNVEDIKENDKTVNISSDNINLSSSTEPINETIDCIKSLTHAETKLCLGINNVLANTSIVQMSQLVVSDDMSDIPNNTTVDESDILKTEVINDAVKRIPTVMNDIQSKIIDNIISPSSNNCSVGGMDLDVSTHYTQDIQDFNSENCNECIEISKPTVTDDDISMVDAKIQNAELSLSSTNNNTSVTRMELDVSGHDLEDSENPFETKNNLAESTESCDSVIENVILKNRVDSVPLVSDNKSYDKIDINTSVIGMDLDVSKHDSEGSENVVESRNLSLFEIPGHDNLIEDVIETKDIEGVLTISNEKHEILMKTEVKIIEEVSLPSTYNNFLVPDVELDVLKPELEDMLNTTETNQLTASKEEQDCQSDIENLNAVKCPEMMDDNNEIISENDLKIDEVINIPENNNSVTEMELGVSKHNLRANETQIKPSCRDTDIEDFEIEKTDFESIPRLPDERIEFISESNNTVNGDLILPLTRGISPEKVLVVSNRIEEIIENTPETAGLIPSSPPISSKFTQNGYNINFDEIDDPFTTKTNIRLSPTSSISNEDFSMNKCTKNITDLNKTPQLNRRKTLHDRRKSNVAEENTNASLNCLFKDDEFVNICEKNEKIQEIYMKDNKKQDIIEKNINSVTSSFDKVEDIEINILNSSPILGKTNKISSSSNDIYKSKNVFNLPEIDDMNFNPFGTKSKILQSPTKETDFFLFDKSKTNDNERAPLEVSHNPLEQSNIECGKTENEKNNIQDLKPNLSSNFSNETCSSNNADDKTPVKEVHTEDEDTVEGPFLEAEDFGDIVKVADFGTEKDMMNFENLPPQTNDDNENGEFFIDAEAFEFLLNQNKSNVVADSGKESLFLKFDPLFAKRVSSDGVLAALNKIQKRQNTPKKLTPIMHEESPVPGPSNTTPISIAAPISTDIVEEPVAAMAKPMMVVNPAVVSIVSPRKSTTPPRVNRRSLTFTSPAMAVIDRLLSLSGNNSRLDQDSSLLSREYNETDVALTQLRELLAEKEIHVHNLRSESKDLKERLALLESQVRSLETESEERLRKVKDLNEHLEEKNKINKSMAIVVEEYERTIASLIAEMEQEKKQNAEERMKLISERDEQTAHLASMEVSFSDLHSKYEKSKQIILSMKANEDTYKKSLNEFEVNLLKMQTNYDLLKQHATSKLNHANQELEKYNRAHDAEVLKLNAMIKRKDLHITSLEESLSQKTKANEELTAICDELINKVG